MTKAELIEALKTAINALTQTNDLNKIEAILDTLGEAQESYEEDHINYRDDPREQ